MCELPVTCTLHFMRSAAFAQYNFTHQFRLHSSTSIAVVFTLLCVRCVRVTVNTHAHGEFPGSPTAEYRPAR